MESLEIAAEDDDLQAVIAYQTIRHLHLAFLDKLHCLALLLYILPMRYITKSSLKVNIIFQIA